MKEIKYQSWPLGKLKAYQLRKEPYLIKNKGYAWKDPWDIVNIFEKKVARFSGCKYAVAVDCCSHGIFLTLKFLNAKKIITIPKRTYVSVPMQIRHAGCKIRFKEIKWEGAYRLDPFPIWDFAGRWTEGMFNGEFNILSFQLKKRIPIGRGGMILTNNKNAYRWLKKASYDCRDLNIDYIKNKYPFLGWHYYMTPEDAARGILLMDKTKKKNEDTFSDVNYGDLSKFKIFK